MACKMPIARKEVIAILSKPLDHEWRAHGIGFMKTYLDPDKSWRLNIYHRMLVNPGISIMHDHPWPLESNIMSGVLYNRRFDREPNGHGDGEQFHQGIINCAEFNGLEAEPDLVTLYPGPPETYRAGASYSQQPEEIHETVALDGTATVMFRGPVTDGLARVFWPAGTDWGDASRPITTDEILAVANRALTLITNEG